MLSFHATPVADLTMNRIDNTPYKVIVSNSPVGNPNCNGRCHCSLPAICARKFIITLNPEFEIISYPAFHTKGGDFCFMIEEPITQSSSSKSQIQMVATVQ